MSYDPPSAASTIGFVGAMASLSGDVTGDYTSLTTLTWDAEQYDTDGFHSTSSNTSRLTVPDLSATYGARAAKVSIACNVSMSNFSATDIWISLRVNKNGSPAVGLPFKRFGSHDNGSPGGEYSAHNIPVTGDGTDYFEVLMQTEIDTSITIAANRSCFQIWVTDWQ